MNRILVLITLCTLFLVPLRGEHLITLPQIATPNMLVVDAQHYFIGEKAEIRIYDRQTHALLQSFGKEGEGPKEFMLTQGGRGLDLFPYADELLVNSLGKLSLWTRQGEFIREFKTRTGSMPSLFQRLGAGYVGFGFTGDDESGRADLCIFLYDSHFNKIKMLSSRPLAQRGQLQFPVPRPAFGVEGNQIFSPAESGFRINVFSASGDRVGDIEQVVDPLPMTDAYRKEVHRFFREDPRLKERYEQMKPLIQFLDFFPAIQNFWVNMGRVYVQTYRKNSQGWWEFFIFQTDGTPVKRCFAPVRMLDPVKPAPLSIYDGKLYQLVDRDEVWGLERFAF